MRQLVIQVPEGCGQEALEIARRHNGSNLSLVRAQNDQGPADLLIVHVSNDRVDPLMEDLQELPGLQITLPPQGVIVLKPPASEAPEQAKNVIHLSPIEIFLSGLQSIGSWRGFLAYAFFGGVVVWIGLLTNTIYLLVAAMLIAPFAGPAMTLALGTARGDTILMRQSVLRYFSSLLVTIAVCALLSWLFQVEVPTTLMIDVANVSAVAFLLPLVAGAAGAVHLATSERNSLVSGAAVGLLVAASLTPPAGLVGIAATLGRWDLAQSGFFLLLLQLAGINFAGASVFRLYGLNPKGVRYDRGKRHLSWLSFGATLIALAALLTWQFVDRPTLERNSRVQRAVAVVHEVVEASGLADVVEVNLRFTRADIAGQDSLLGVIYVQPASGPQVGPEEIRQRLTQAIQQQLLAEGFEATPLIQVNVLEPPPAAQE